MRPLHYYAIAVTVIAIVLGAVLFVDISVDLTERQLLLQAQNDSLRRDMADRDGLIAALSVRDSLWRRRFIQLVAEDQPTIIYRMQHERFANTSGDSAVEFLLAAPDSLWSATYPGRSAE